MLLMLQLTRPSYRSQLTTAIRKLWRITLDFTSSLLIDFYALIYHQKKKKHKRKFLIKLELEK